MMFLFMVVGTIACVYFIWKVIGDIVDMIYPDKKPTDDSQIRSDQ